MDNETKLEIEEMKRRLNQLESLQTNPVDRLAGTLSEKVIEDVIRDKIVDLTWDDYYFFSSFFESIDGWGLSDSGTSGVLSTSVKLDTGASTNDTTYIRKVPENREALSYDYEGRFRTSFIIDATAGNDDEMEFNMTVGQGGNGDTNAHYGFRFEDGTLYGVVADGTTETKVSLQTGIGIDEVIIVEARFYPGGKVVFYSSDADESVLIERGVATTNLPSGDISTWFEFKIKTTEAAKKAVFISYVEYIQRRVRYS